MEKHESHTFVKRPLLEIILFILSLITIAYWALIWFVISDVYSNKLAGTVYEILWIVMMPCLAILPILSFMYFRKTRYRIGRLPFYTFILNLVLVTMLITKIVVG